ncbi:unnamed protein product, partial [Closterium sp. NIES-54]
MEEKCAKSSPFCRVSPSCVRAAAAAAATVVDSFTLPETLEASGLHELAGPRSDETSYIPGIPSDSEGETLYEDEVMSDSAATLDSLTAAALPSEIGAKFDLSADSEEDSASDHVEQPARLTRDTASCYNVNSDEDFDVDVDANEPDPAPIPPPRNLSLTETIASADHDEAESASATVAEDTSALTSNSFPTFTTFSRHQRREFRMRMALSRIQRRLHACCRKMRGGAWNNSNRATQGGCANKGRRYSALKQHHGPCNAVSRVQMVLKKQQGALPRAMARFAQRSRRAETRGLQAHQGCSSGSSGEFWERGSAEERKKAAFVVKAGSDEGGETGMREEGWVMGQSVAPRSILGHGSLVREVDRCKMCRVWVERISLGDCAAESTYGADVCAALDHGHDVTADISRPVSEHGRTGIHTATETATATARSDSHGTSTGEGLSSNISVASTNASAISSARSTSTYSTSTYVSGSTAGDAIGRSLALGCSLAFGSTLAIATSLSFGGSLAIASSIAFGSSLAVVSSCAVDDSTGRRRRRDGGKKARTAEDKVGAEAVGGENGKAGEGKKGVGTGDYEEEGRGEEGRRDDTVASVVAAHVECSKEIDRSNDSSYATRSSLVSRRGRRQPGMRRSMRRSSSFSAPPSDAWFSSPLFYYGAQSEGSFPIRSADAAFPRYTWMKPPRPDSQAQAEGATREESGERDRVGVSEERNERDVKEWDE